MTATRLPHYPALLLLPLLAGCKVNDPFPKPPPPANQVDLLPPATQTGRRTFGCLLNGQAWNLAGNPFNGPLFTAQYSSKHLSLVAKGTTTSPDGMLTGGIVQIDIDNINSAGTYALVEQNISFANYDNFTTKCSYYTDATHPATVEITRLDLVNRVVSGRFAFTLETPGCAKIVVTEGRFDSLF